MNRRAVWCEIDGVWHKRCTGCGELLPEGAFYKHRDRAFGVTSDCKKCHTARAERWRKANVGRYNAKKAAWNALHRNRVTLLPEVDPHAPVDEKDADAELERLDREIAYLFGDDNDKEVA